MPYNKPLIAIVDDDVPTIEMLSEIFSDEDYQPMVLVDSAVAWACEKENRPL